MPRTKAFISAGENVSPSRFLRIKSCAFIALQNNFTGFPASPQFFVNFPLETVSFFAAMRDNNITMKIKSILRIAAFSITFIFSAAFAGLFIEKSETRTNLVVPSFNSGMKRTSCFGYAKGSLAGVAGKINYILQKDDDNGRAHTAKIRRVSADNQPPFNDDAAFDAYADATVELALSSGAIDRDGVSPEFKSVWRTHMQAWRDYADFLESMKTASVRHEVGTLAFDEVNEQFSDEINRSWYEVLRVADENGVDTRYYRRTSN